jgi:glycosyltransferase involved in cell wall biosynthesis
VACLPSTEVGTAKLALAAMASGVPVVATSAGTVSEIVPASAGVLVPPGNVEALAEALIALFASPVRRRQLGEAGQQAAAAYDWPLVARRFLEELERPAQ